MFYNLHALIVSSITTRQRVETNDDQQNSTTELTQKDKNSSLSHSLIEPSLDQISDFRGNLFNFNPSTEHYNTFNITYKTLCSAREKDENCLRSHKLFPL